MPSNKIRNFRFQCSIRFYKLCVTQAFFVSKTKIIKEQLFSQILELGITLVSRFENITFDHYLTKPESMLEWKLLAMSAKNPEIVRAFDYKRYNHRYSHPLSRKFFDIYLDEFY